MRARPSRSVTLRLIAGLALALLVLAVPQPTGAQASADIAVVVHPDVPVDNLSFADLRRIVLGDREFWPAGTRVTLLVRAPIARERDVMVKNVCQMTEAQFRQHWIGKVFRAETAMGPRIVYSTEMALDQVSRVPGAMAFVDASAVGQNAKVKVLKIDGKAPGQAGYPLK